ISVETLVSGPNGVARSFYFGAGSSCPDRGQPNSKTETVTADSGVSSVAASSEPIDVTAVSAENYATIISQRVGAERLALARRWLERLNELLIVAPNEVFPSDQL